MAKVKSYLNPNIPKPKPGKGGGDNRYKPQPVKPDKPKPGRPGINPPRKPGIEPPRKKRPEGIGRPKPKPSPGNGGSERPTPKPGNLKRRVPSQKAGPRPDRTKRNPPVFSPDGKIISTSGLILSSRNKPGKPKPKPLDPRKERQLPGRIKPEGRRRKSSDMGKTANNGRIKPGTRGR